MWNRKNLLVLAVMINIIIAVLLSVNVRADDPPAGDELATMNISVPDALIILDLSGSMAWNPTNADGRTYGVSSCSPDPTLCNNPEDLTYPYFADATCTANDTAGACHGSTDTTRIYGADATCNASDTTGGNGLCTGTGSGTYKYASSSSCTPDSDVGNCVVPTDSHHFAADSYCRPSYTAGTCVSPVTSPYIYAKNSTCTASTSSCKGTGCSGGFCSSSKSGCSTNCYRDCSDGFCAASKTGCTFNCSSITCSGGFCNASKNGCSTNCSTYDCVGGYCKNSKTGCSTNCDCQDGACKNSKTGCSVNCGNNDCQNGFCNTASQVDCNTDCSRVAIAKRALFNILDDDGNLTINNNDAQSLGVRLGFMRYKDGNDTSNDYNSGNIKLVDVISQITGGVASQNGTSYQLTYCGNSTSCLATTGACPIASGRLEVGRAADSSSCNSTPASCTSGECIAGENANGGTPLASSLKEGLKYLNDHKNADPYKSCRQKFVILVTDGDDTYACSGDGGECQTKMYARRREVVAATKQLNDAGYRVFVIGFGENMPTHLKNTLNWMALYGGTDSPADNVGSITNYNVPLATSAQQCNLSTNPTYCYPSGISSCQTDTSTITNTDCGSSQSGYRATNNDPGYFDLSGYAFLAGNARDLTGALKSAINTIRDATYSFTQVSVQASRTISENYLYEATFQPIAIDPLWLGHLKRYGICGLADCASPADNGKVKATSDWDAGEILRDTLAANRNIYTLNPSTGVLKEFETDNLTNAILGVTTDANRTSLVNFIRAGELDASYAHYGWKLGDILHSVPLAIASPNENFYDTNDTSSPRGYETFRVNHQRTSANELRIIVVGANDGQLHAFKVGEVDGTTGGGSEVWSFIPPNLLPKLVNIAHDSHPATGSHGYYVDGLSTAAEIWLGTGTIGSTAKSAGDWHTYLISSLGRGGISTLWSRYSYCACPMSASDCGTAFSSTYSSTYKYYCGYYAFDISDTSAAPIYKWILGGTSGLSSNVGSYLGQPWSKMFIGRVRLNQAEKWVGLIGGGCAGTNCASTAPSDTRGKGFFVVDLSSGAIMWKYTYADNSSMAYSITASPAGLDYDGDGFMDTVYIGDTGGNMWRFKFCLAGEDTVLSPCTYSKWSGSLLLNNH